MFTVKILTRYYTNSGKASYQQHRVNTVTPTKTNTMKYTRAQYPVAAVSWINDRVRCSTVGVE